MSFMELRYGLQRGYTSATVVNTVHQQPLSQVGLVPHRVHIRSTIAAFTAVEYALIESAYLRL
jgi:hypothetical protein